jgi:hypothetical protein
MCGVTRTGSWAASPDDRYVYYMCYHRPSDPRRTLPEGHSRTISVREDHLLQATSDFLATSVFGPDRRQLLAASMPATATDDQHRRDTQAAALRKRLRQIDTAENAHAREIETLAHLTDPHAPALTALRSRILARFTELENERTQISTQLTGLDKTGPKAGDPTLLDRLPLLGDILADAPPRLLQQLCQAFDLQILYKKNMHQVSISITITDSTPHAVAAIIAAAGIEPSTPAATEPDISQPHFSDLAQAPIRRESTNLMTTHPMAARRGPGRGWGDQLVAFGAGGWGPGGHNRPESAPQSGRGPQGGPGRCRGSCSGRGVGG